MLKKSLLIMLLALFVPWTANAQTRAEHVFGDDASSAGTYSPYGGYYGFEYYVYLYDAADMNFAGTISAVSFKRSTATNESDVANYTLWMRDVPSGTTLSANTTFAEYTDGLTPVFESVGMPAHVQGWNTTTLDNVFEHKAGNAILVMARAEGCTNTGGCQKNVFYKNVSNHLWYKRADRTDPGTNVSGILISNLPSVKFTFEPIAGFCPSPIGLQISKVTDAGATFAWTSETGNFIFEYKTHATATWTSVNLTANTYTLSGLTMLTAYDVRVKAVCEAGVSESGWLEGSFSTTAYAEPVGDSWSDDFEGATCSWELVNSSLANAWAWGSATNNGGAYALYVSNDGGTNNAYSNGNTMVYATKLLSFAEGKYEFTYDWKANGEGNWDYLRVALVPASVTLTAGTSVPFGFSASDLPSTWIALDGGSKLNAVTTWQNKSLSIDVADGSYYLVMAWYNDSDTNNNPPAAIDNVSITHIACAYDVEDLAVSNITSDGATLTWTAGEATQWQVAYSTNSAFEGATEEMVNSATYNMTGLSSATAYYARVRACCGGTDFGAWSEVEQFNTECDAIDLNTMDFSEDFDGITVASAYMPPTRTLPVCWNYINTSTYASNAVYPTIYNYGSNSNSSPNSLRFYCSYSSYNDTDPQDQYAILPEMEYLASKQITLQAKGQNAYSSFKIGTMTDPTDVSTFEEIATQQFTSDNYSSYNEYTFVVPANCTANYMAIMVEAASSSLSTCGVYIDDITIADIPPCVKPKDFEFISATTTTATFRWSNGSTDQTAWQIAYSTDPTFNPDDVAPVDVTSNPGTIGGLTASTVYYAYVRANCGANGYSDWCLTYSQFATSCDAVNFPWTEDFDGLTAGIPICWDNSEGTTTNNTFKWNYYATGHAGACVRFDSYNNPKNNTSFLKTVPLNLPTTTPMELTFWYKNPTGGDFSVYISTDGGVTHTTALATGLTADVWTEHSAIDLRAYAGQEVVIVFKGTSNFGNGDAYIYLDDVAVDEASSCATPIALDAINVTTGSADLKWTAITDETEWTIYYKQATDATYTEIAGVTDNPYTLTGLDAATSYEFFVVANCSDTDESSPSEVFDFTTLCEAISIFPWNEDFENFSASSAGVTLDDPCWVNEHLAGTGAHFFEVYDGANGSNSTSQLRLHDMASGTMTKLVLPEMVLSNDNYEFSLDVYRNATGTNYTTEGIRVFASANAEIEGATELAFISRNYSVSDEGYIPAEDEAGWYTYDLPISMVGTCYIVLRGESQYGSATYMDNFSVKEIRSCQTPSNLTAENITATSAMLSWTLSTETEWTLYYKKNTDATYTEMTGVTENPYTLTGLDAETLYEYCVVANCSATEESYPSEVFGFYTACSGPVTAFPWTEDFESFEANGNGVTLDAPCWENEHLEGAGAYFFEIYNGTNGINSTNQLRLHDMYEGTMTKLVLPEMILPNNNYLFSIDVYRNNTYSSKTDEGIRVFASTNGEIEDATELAFIPRVRTVESGVIPAENVDGWYTYELPINMSGTCYIILRGESKYGAATYMDNLTVKGIPSSTVTQDIALSSGWNWVSFDVDITLADLKAALAAAAPGTQIVIKSKDNKQATYNPTANIWVGQLNTLDLTQMYRVKVTAACQAQLTGLPIDLSTTSITIKKGANWISFPGNATMTLQNAFAGFAANGDKVKSKDNKQATYNTANNLWIGQLKNLEPGNGYIFTSTQDADRILVFPSAK